MNLSKIKKKHIWRGPVLIKFKDIGVSITWFPYYLFFFTTGYFKFPVFKQVSTFHVSEFLVVLFNQFKVILYPHSNLGVGNWLELGYSFQNQKHVN